MFGGKLTAAQRKTSVVPRCHICREPCTQAPTGMHSHFMHWDGFKLSNFMQPKSIETVCNNIKKLSNSALQQPIENVTTQFTTVLTLFSKCHHGYNSSKFMSDEDIKQLGRIIQMYKYA